MEPSSLKILVVDSKGVSRQLVCSLLRDCSYQVTPVRTAREALQLLTGHTEDAPAFDLILKEHEPPGANAVRLLRKLGKGVHTRSIPLVVMSTQDDREIVATCLNRGATDYLVKPLRHNELRHIWTRVWWWQRNKEQSRQNIGHYLPTAPYEYPDSLSSASSDTECSDDDDEPTSKEGSAPDANAAHGSNGKGSNGSKEGNGTSRVDAKAHDGSNGEGGSNNGDGGSNGNGNGSSDNKNGNGSSDNKNGNGNSANKNGHHGSNGNGASTTAHLERRGSHALVGTAEGRVKQQGEGLQEDHILPPKSARAGSAFAQYVGPSTTSRKRPAYELAQLTSGRDSNPEGKQGEQGRRQASGHRQVRGSNLAAGCVSPLGMEVAEEGGQQGGAHQHQHQHQHTGNTQLGLLPPDFNQQAAVGQQLTALQHNLSARAAVGQQLTALQHNLSARAAAGQLPWQGGRHGLPGGLPTGSQVVVGQQGPGLPPPHAFPMYPAPSHFGVIQNSIHPLTLYSNSPAMSGHQSVSHASHASLEGRALQQMPAMRLLGPEQIIAAKVAAANLSQQAAAATSALANNPQLGAMLLGQLLQLNQTLNPQQQTPQALAQQQAAAAAPPPLQQAGQPAVSAGPPITTAPLPSLTTSWRPQTFTPQVAVLSGGLPAVAPQDTSFASGGATNGNVSNGNGSTRSGRTERESRQQALDKYRNKRKNLKFGKTIRYESRKALAQQRPRLKGQFVKHSQQGSSQGNGTAGDASLGGSGGRTRGLSARYWQNGAQDEQNQNFGLHEELEDEEYDRDDELDEDMGEGQAIGQTLPQELPDEPPNQDEMDVVNSLRELQRQASLQRQAAAAAAAAAQAAEGGGVVDGTATATAAAVAGKGSSGGQSHSHHSRGSHEHRGAHSHGHQYQRSTQASNDPRAQLTVLLVADLQRDSQREPQEGSNGNAKNGSDSGSNSPDDNARGQKLGGHLVQSSHGHRYE